MRASSRRLRPRGRHTEGETGVPVVGLAAGHPLSAFRAAVLRRSVPILFVTVTLLGLVAAIDGVRLDGAAITFLGTTLVGLGLATRVPWDRAAANPESWAGWVWSVIVALVLGGLALVPGLSTSARPLLAAVVVMTGLVLEPVRHAAVTVLTLVLVAGSYVVRDDSTIRAAIGPILIVAVTALAVAYVSRELERTALRDRDHVRDLAEERAAFQRLYDVASTLGGSESVDVQIPALLGRLATYLDSELGAWFSLDEHSGVLRLERPIVSGGRVVDPGDAPPIPTSEMGFLARALRSERPVALRVETRKSKRDGILGELGVRSALAAPLILEGRRVGVVLLGNPTKGHFDESDVEELRVLAAPAGLVLGQIRRHQQAEDVNQRLREVAEMKTDFVSIVSHELRTPLTSIRGALDTLGRPGLIEQDTIVSELVGSARRQTSRLERLINDLLVASRLDRGTMKSVLVPVSIAEVLDEVIPQVGYTGIRVDVAPAAVIAADHDQFTQVVRNLLENAVKYGGGSDIDVSVVREHGGLTLIVADHGPGIPEIDRARVFERFVQLERPEQRSHEGSGLGLSIVKSLVDSMGGRISVTDTPGGGATFRVSFRAAGTLDLHPLAGLAAR